MDNRALRGPWGAVDYHLGHRYNWAAVEQAARNSPLLRQVVEAAHGGREEALCTAVMYLAAEQCKWLDERAEEARHTPPTPIILPKGATL